MSRVIAMDGYTDRECRPHRITRSLLGYGVLAGPVYLVTALAQGLLRPGFDLMHDDVSLLSNGSLGWIQIANFIVTGAFVIAAAVGMARALGSSSSWGPRLLGAYGLGLVAAGVFVSSDERLPGGHACRPARSPQPARRSPHRRGGGRLPMPHCRLLRAGSALRQGTTQPVDGVLGAHRCLLPAGVRGRCVRINQHDRGARILGGGDRLLYLDRRGLDRPLPQDSGQSDNSLNPIWRPRLWESVNQSRSTPSTASTASVPPTRTGRTPASAMSCSMASSGPA